MTVPATFLMTAYNAENTIGRSIQSVLNQSCPDFELLIVDDASTDDTCDIVKSFEDKRIRLIRNPENLYIPGAANMGLRSVDTDYILRLDADDFCHPQRLELQLNFMNTHPDVGVCGTYAKFFGASDAVWKMPLTDPDIKAYMLFNNPFTNSSVIIRNSFLKKNDLDYRNLFPYPPIEDYDLWMRAIPYTSFANMNSVLVYKYSGPETHTQKYHDQYFETHKKFFSEHLDNLGLRMDDQELDVYLALSSGLPLKQPVSNYINLLMRIMDHFGKHPFFDAQSVRISCIRKWLVLSVRAGWYWGESRKDFMKFSKELKIRYPYIKLWLKKVNLGFKKEGC